MATTTSSMNFSTEFWNGTAAIYGDAEMTKHKSDEEMEYVLKTYDTDNFTQLMCFGVADGSRDPCRILEHIKIRGKLFPKRMLFNDLSPELLKVCHERVETNYMKETEESRIDYYAQPMSEIETERIGGGVTALLGVYNSDYIEESLRIYSENSEILGGMYTMRALLLKEGELETGKEMIEFNIKEYKEYMDKIRTLTTHKNFLAYSLMTDKNFVTHYYLAWSLNRMMKGIFKDADARVEIVMPGDRYIIVEVTDDIENEEGQTLVTSLNNVLGNIPYEHMISSVKKMKEIINL